MAGFNQYLDNAIINQIFGGVQFANIPFLYFGLSLTPITYTGTGCTEIVGNGYSRVAVANTIANFPITTNATKSNNLVVIFPQSTGSWGIVNSYAIFDSATQGNIIASGNLTNSKTIDAEDTVSFGVGQLTISLS